MKNLLFCSLVMLILSGCSEYEDSDSPVSCVVNYTVCRYIGTTSNVCVEDNFTITPNQSTLAYNNMEQSLRFAIVVDAGVPFCEARQCDSWFEAPSARQMGFDCDRFNY